MESAVSTVVEGWKTVCTAVDGIATPAVVTEQITELSEKSGVAPPEIRLFLCLVAAYPIAFLWRALPGASVRHMFSVVTGWWMLQFILGYQWIHCMIPSLLVYASMAILGPKARYLTFMIAFGYLTGGHIYRQYTDYLGWTLDWTMQMMVITQKLSAIGFNYYDGLAEDASPSQKSRAIKTLPSLLEYLSFILFPGTLAIGPAFEFTDYRKFATGELTSPNPVLPSLWRFVQGISLFVAHNGVMMYFPTWALLTDKDMLSAGTVPLRFAKIWVSLLGYRFKYYFGWKVAEGAAVMSGLGYNGTDKVSGKDKWDRVENIDVVGYETSQSLRDSASCWNKTTNLWLRRYVYERVRNGINLYATYFVSAFWHGFYPGYYMFFLSVAVATQVHRNFRRAVRPRFMAADGKTPGPYKPLYDVFSFVCANMTTNYFIISFVVLAADLCFNAFMSLYFIGHVALVLAFLVFGTGMIRPPKAAKAPTKAE